MVVLRIRICIFCGLRHVSADGWCVCEHRGAILTADGVTHRRLPPMLCQFVNLMLWRRNKLTSQTEICDELWPDADDSPQAMARVVKEYVRQARDVMHITNYPGRGYEYRG